MVKFISKYFSDIIYVDSNPCTITSIQKYKENGELKSKGIKKEYKLTITNLDNFFDSIIDNKSINNKIIDFYPKSFIQKIWNKKCRNLQSEIENITENNYIIQNSLTNLKNSEFLCKKKDVILIGTKSSTIILKKDSSDLNIEYAINPDEFIILKLT